MPFDHLTLAEVAECERLLAADWAGRLPSYAYRWLHPLLARRHPPLYEPEPDRCA